VVCSVPLWAQDPRRRCADRFYLCYQSAVLTGAACAKTGGRAVDGQPRATRAIRYRAVGAQGPELVQPFVWVLTGVSGTMASVLSVWDDAKSRFVPQEVSITPPTSSFASRVAASALAVAKPVYTTSTGKVALCNATELSVRKGVWRTAKTRWSASSRASRPSAPVTPVFRLAPSRAVRCQTLALLAPTPIRSPSRLTARAASPRSRLVARSRFPTSVLLAPTLTRPA